MRRVYQNSIIGLASSGITAVFLYTIDSKQVAFELSMAAGYIGLVLIALSLIIGPWNILRCQPNPISSDIRRDIGIWGGIFSIVHVIIGLQVHMGGKFWLYFIYPPDQPHRILLRYDFFGFANFTGLSATLIIIMLLITSNAISMRKLGTALWKKIQRWNYVGGVLIILHSIAYQFIENRNLPFIALFSLIALMALTFQVAGFKKIQKTR